MSEGTPILTVQALNRLSYYQNYLQKRKNEGVELMTATTVAEDLGINEVVVRKDISAVRRTKGRPNTGFSVVEMLERIEDCLGFHASEDAIIVGVGNLGKSLISGLGLERFGIRILAGFDADPAVTDKEYDGVTLLPMRKLKSLCQRLNIDVGIIAVPEESAQGVCNLLVASGIHYILNYAQVFLTVPETVYVQNENPAASLIAFSQHVRSKTK